VCELRVSGAPRTLGVRWLAHHLNEDLATAKIEEGNDAESGADLRDLSQPLAARPAWLEWVRVGRRRAER
jgi:hypothetical protein